MATQDRSVDQLVARGVTAKFKGYTLYPRIDPGGVCAPCDRSRVEPCLSVVGQELWTRTRALRHVGLSGGWLIIELRDIRVDGAPDIDPGSRVCGSTYAESVREYCEPGPSTSRLIRATPRLNRVQPFPFHVTRPLSSSLSLLPPRFATFLLALSTSH